MTYYKYISVIETQDCEGNAIGKRMVVCGKKVSEGCNIAPFTPGRMEVIHVEKLPYEMERLDIREYLKEKGKSIFKYCNGDKK